MCGAPNTLVVIVVLDALFDKDSKKISKVKEKPTTKHEDFREIAIQHVLRGKQFAKKNNVNDVSHNEPLKEAL